MTENTIDRPQVFRILLLAFLVMLMLSAIIIRLWSVQILSGQEFDESVLCLFNQRCPVGKEKHLFHGICPLKDVHDGNRAARFSGSGCHHDKALPAEFVQ